jgi:hypothetical protein
MASLPPEGLMVFPHFPRFPRGEMDQPAPSCAVALGLI